MAKRFTDTEIWKEDWFLEMPYEYMFLWNYLKDTCDHAGIWKPNKKFVEFITGKKINYEIALSSINSDKERILVLPNKKWLILDFFVFQYGSILNEENRVHQSIVNIFDKNNIELKLIRGLKEVKLRSTRGQLEVKHGVKDKDKDKDKDIRASVNDALKDKDKEKDKNKEREEREERKNVKNVKKKEKEIDKEKIKFLEFVFLSNDEHQKLVQKLTESKTKEMIERLNNYVGSTGKKYKSHYHTILTWENKEPKAKPQDNRYSKILEEIGDGHIS